MNLKKLISIFICLLTISFCISCSSGINPDMIIISTPDKSTINYYEYNSSTKKQKKIHNVTKTCYPTASLSQDNKILYYTKIDENGCPQLFSRDIKKNSDKQLTFMESDNIMNVDFFKINYDKNIIYLRVILKDHINFNLAIYDIKSEKIKILDKNEFDISNQFFDFSNDSQSILAIENSEKEKYDVMEKANDTQDMSLAAKNTIKLKDENGKEESTYDSLEKDISDVSLSPDKSTALILTSEAGKSDEQDLLKHVLLKDFNNNENSQSILDNTGSYKNISQLCFSNNGKGFYFLASESDLNNTDNNIYYYNFDSKETNKQINIDNEDILYFSIIKK